MDDSKNDAVLARLLARKMAPLSSPLKATEAVLQAVDYRALLCDPNVSLTVWTEGIGKRLCEALIAGQSEAILHIGYDQETCLQFSLEECRLALRRVIQTGFVLRCVQVRVTPLSPIYAQTATHERAHHCHVLVRMVKCDLSLLQSALPWAEKLPREAPFTKLPDSGDVSHLTLPLEPESTPSTVAHVAEIRIAVLGNVDAGKSSLLGVLAHAGGMLDDGRGKARQALARHWHESETGRTSSVGQALLGFDATGRVIAPLHSNALVVPRSKSSQSVDEAVRSVEQGNSWTWLSAQKLAESLPCVESCDETGVAKREEVPSLVPLTSTSDESTPATALASSVSHAGTIASRRLPCEEICLRSSKLITFIDLAGHEKYLRTTVYGMTGCAPDYVMLMIGANAGIIGMTKEHLGLALALRVPVLVVVTKVDSCPPNILAQTLRQLTRLLKSPGCRKTPVGIRSVHDVIATAGQCVSGRLCPVFQVSNVTGESLDLLTLYLNLLPVYGKFDSISPLEFQITDTYSVPGVGCVVAGTVLQGTLMLGQTVYLGPDTTGHLQLVQCKGIQRKRINVPFARAGQTASMALKKVKRSSLRKGMLLLGKETRFVSTEAMSIPALISLPLGDVCREFDAEILVLFHSTTIRPNYQAMLHCGTVRQTVVLRGLQRLLEKEETFSDPKEMTDSTKTEPTGASTSATRPVLRTGDRSLVRFRFLRFPEYLKQGAKLLFREGRTKGVGKVVSVYPVALPVPPLLRQMHEPKNDL